MAGTHRLNLHYHYAIEPSVGLFFALPGAIAIALRPLTRFPHIRPGWLAFLVFAFASATYLRSEPFRIVTHVPSAQATYLRKEIAPRLDPDASVAATDAWIPHLIARRWTSNLHERRDDRGEPVQCIWVDRAARSWPLDAAAVEKALQEISAEGYQVEYEYESLSVLSRPGRKCLRNE
jgi:hypothetical protein